jgi:hypothetical protein
MEEVVDAEAVWILRKKKESFFSLAGMETRFLCL